MPTLDLLVVLDRSGSMAATRRDHEGGLRAFIEDQKTLDGDVRLTFVRFDDKDPCEIVYDRTRLHEVGPIELIPRGGTPLLDAMGGALAHLAAQHPEEVVALIVTDGEENASHEWTRDRVKARVAELEQQGWTFLFLGAPLSAFAEAGSLGVHPAMAAAFTNTSRGASAFWVGQAPAKLGAYRAARASGQSVNSARSALAYTQADRDALLDEDAAASTETITTAYAQACVRVRQAVTTTATEVK